MANILGTTGNDVIRPASLGGSSGTLSDATDTADTIDGRAGDDRLHGGGGSDTLDGGAGADFLEGSDGDDVITDVAEGLLNPDRYPPESGRAEGGAGDDRITVTLTSQAQGHVFALGGAGDDTITLFGSHGNNLSFAGECELHGGDGNDTLTNTAGEPRTLIFGETGDDMLRGADNTDYVNGGAGSDWLDGGAGNDLVLDQDRAGNAELDLAADVLLGGAGDDILESVGGADTFDGGSGDDSVRIDRVYSDAPIRFVASAPGAVAVFEGDGSTVTGVESFVLKLGGGADRIRLLGDHSDWVESNGGEDVVGTGGGHDYVIAGNDSDRVRAGAGNDTVFAGHSDAANDDVCGGEGDDFLYGGGGNDLLNGGLGNDEIDGEAGVDTAAYNTVTRGVAVDLWVLGLQDTGGAGLDRLTRIENLIGSSSADRLLGNSGANAIDGGAGSDFLEGRGGDDILRGQAGNDTLRGGSGNDRLDGGTGTDLASWLGTTASVRVDLAQTGPQDTGGAGSDTLLSIESLAGGSVDDVLQGDAAANAIWGNEGADRIEGRGGVDRLTGGEGPDRFVYGAVSHAAAGPALETITDFGTGDVIDLEAIDTGTGAGDQDFAWIGDSAFTGAGGQLRQAGGVVQGDLDGDRIADLAIRIANGALLGAGSFDL